MDFLSKLLQGIAFVPAVVNGIEGLFGNRSGLRRRTRQCHLYKQLYP